MTERDPLHNDVKAGPCPPPEALLALPSGVLPEEVRLELERHLSGCPACRQLLEGPAAIEQRIDWKREPTGSLPSRSRRRGLAFAALVLAIGIAFWKLPLRQTRSLPAAQVRPAVVSPSAGPHLPLARAPVQLPAAALLQFRTGNGDPYWEELHAALAPYNEERYLDAQGQLQKIVAKYPQGIEAGFYLAVADLLVNDNVAGRDALRKLPRDPGHPLAPAIAWYSAVAAERTGDIAGARGELDGLCKGSSPYREQACTALDSLK